MATTASPGVHVRTGIQSTCNTVVQVGSPVYFFFSLLSSEYNRGSFKKQNTRTVGSWWFPDDRPTKNEALTFGQWCHMTSYETNKHHFN
ncbi:hypothetical protein CEXT_632561 [Caerostris extrusa]|uniref:Uncharacterized protein n=1 Tax=Caerostris extrusa TaxID=172846 RepID=A0AAV4RS07_CAEEX|nr:hypothetical protein CEXT_632561 [Caerostris extrusa]